jgi:hypothetical protein
VQLRAPIPERREEAEPFEVIQVEMAEQDVDPFRRRAIQRCAERADPGSGIEDDEATVFGTHLHARRVATGANGVRPRRRQ